MEKFIKLFLQEYYNASSKDHSPWSESTFEAINELPFENKDLGKS